MDPIYGYQALNVEAQQKNAGSLLHWTRRMIEIRKRHPVFGLGDFTELNSSNPSVLAFVRELGDDRVLCVNNLSRFPQPVELDLRRFEGVDSGGVHGRRSVPADRRASVSSDASWAWVLLVHPAAHERITEEA